MLVDNHLLALEDIALNPRHFRWVNCCSYSWHLAIVAVAVVVVVAAAAAGGVGAFCIRKSMAI